MKRFFVTISRCLYIFCFFVIVSSMLSTEGLCDEIFLVDDKTGKEELLDSNVIVKSHSERKKGSDEWGIIYYYYMNTEGSEKTLGVRSSMTCVEKYKVVKSNEEERSRIIQEWFKYGSRAEIQKANGQNVVVHYIKFQNVIPKGVEQRIETDQGFSYTLNGGAKVEKIDLISEQGETLIPFKDINLVNINSKTEVSFQLKNGTTKQGSIKAEKIYQVDLVPAFVGFVEFPGSVRKGSSLLLT